jgi:hypothetical protein
MRIQRHVVLGLAMLSLSSGLGAYSALAATDPLANKNKLPDALEETVGLLRTGLEADGFAVARGYWTLWGADECKYPIQTIGYCYAIIPRLLTCSPWCRPGKTSMSTSVSIT